PLVYSAKKRLEHLDISELAVSEMRQNRQDMGLRIAFCFKVGYAYHKVELLGSGTQARQHQQRKNTMILEAFFSTVASNVFTEIIKQIAAERKRRKDEDIERIVDQVLRKYHPVGQSSIIEREIILILGNAELVGA